MKEAYMIFYRTTKFRLRFIGLVKYLIFMLRSTYHILNDKLFDFLYCEFEPQYSHLSRI